MRTGRLNSLRATVERRAWAVLAVKTRDDLVELADALGEITPSRVAGPAVDELRPKSATEASPRSLSGLHGLDAFPFHTDAAHHALPPRFVLLRFASERASKCRTLIAVTPRRLSKKDREILEHDVWVVDGGRGRRFLTSILTHPDGYSRPMLRFDEGCMRPADKSLGEARAVVFRILEGRRVALEWAPGLAVVIDNWRALHARDAALAGEEERVLERILVSSP